MAKPWLIVGACYGLLGVVLGAFGAHAMRARLSEDLLRAWQTGVEYQMYHAFALLAVGLVAHAGAGEAGWLSVTGWAFTLGVLLFSGSLYALALTGIRPLGAVTPFGGLLLIVGWACLVAAISRHG